MTMKLKAKEQIGNSIKTADSPIGLVDDLYFDDERWTVRYLICNTGDWFSGRRILISPISIIGADADQRVIHVNLAPDLIKSSPDISLIRPVSRRIETEFSKHFNLPIYWGGEGVWGSVVNPQLLVKSSIKREQVEKILSEKSDEAHLRSINEVIGYHIQATDGYIGHIEDFLIDSESWQITRVIVDTKNWLPGKKVMIPPSEIEKINWLDSQISVKMTKETLKKSPEFL